MREEFFWYPDEGIAYCLLSKAGRDYIGSAICAEADKDFMSEKVGCHIASIRAQIEYFVSLRDNELKPQYKILMHLLACMSQSSQYNPDSYEAKRIRKELGNIEDSLTQIKMSLKDLRASLKEYIDSKESYYQRLRAMRASLSGQN